MPDTVVYASVGADLIHFTMDVNAATLTRRETVSVPANVNTSGRTRPADFFTLPAATAPPAWALRAPTITSARSGSIRSGALSPHGAAIPLPHRPIHMATDIPSQHVLVAFNNPPEVRIFRINPDATLGTEVAQPPKSTPVFSRIRSWQRRITGMSSWSPAVMMLPAGSRRNPVRSKYSATMPAC